MANIYDDYDNAILELGVKQKGNSHPVDRTANARDDYDDASIAPDTEQIGYLYCNEIDNYYSTLEYTQGKFTAPCPPPRLRGISKDVSNDPKEHVTSNSRQTIREKRNLKCNHNSSIVKTQRTIIKLVITLSFAIVVITVACSAYGVITIKQDLKEEMSTLKQSKDEGKVWSSWSAWSDCCGTRTVNLRTRNRTCDGQCLGNDADVSTCDNAICNESSWSTWSPWGDCRDTCGQGLRTRNRTCHGSDQYGTHMPCAGNDIDISTCNETICMNFYSIPSIFFSAHTVISNTPVEDQVLVFETNLYNQGEGYNNSTGVFTAPVTGVYHFNVQLCTSQYGQITVVIIMNGNEILRNILDGKLFCVCSSVETSVEMNKGLIANVVAKHVVGTNIIISSNVHINKFSGILIKI